MSDPVNHPSHYTSSPSGIECIQVTEHMNFCIGNAVKYLWRAGLKGDAVEDLKKARWYVEREIQRIESGGRDDMKADPKLGHIPIDRLVRTLGRSYYRISEFQRLNAPACIIEMERASYGRTLAAVRARVPELILHLVCVGNPFGGDR